MVVDQEAEDPQSSLAVDLACVRRRSIAVCWSVYATQLGIPFAGWFLLARYYLYLISNYLVLLSYTKPT